MNNRTKQATRTLPEITSLANLSRKAKLLFSGAGFPKYTLGFQVSGMSRMQWLQLETQAANATHIPKGRCRYSALCITYGPNCHPFARGIKELFILWFKVIVHGREYRPIAFADTENPTYSSENSTRLATTTYSRQHAPPSTWASISSSHLSLGTTVGTNLYR